MAFNNIGVNNLNNNQLNNVRAITLMSIDGVSLGSTLIGKTMSIGRFCPLHINIEPLEVSGTISTPPSISIGTNQTDYNNVISITELIGLLDLNMIYQIQAPSLNLSIAPEADIYIKVTTAVTGITPVYEFRASVIGFYF